MLIIIILVSLLLSGLGFLINEKNARYLLSGYNTMSEAQRQKFDLSGYLEWFRKFHLFLGISLLIFSVIIFYYGGIRICAIFLAIYPILGYGLFLYRTDHFWRQTGSSLNKLGLVVLLISLILVVLMLLLI